MDNRLASEIIEEVFKPKYLRPPPKGPKFNYIVDIYTQSRGAHFYFCSRYACPAPNALSPFFEDRFARLTHMGLSGFNLAYMRHTGKWWEVYRHLPLREAMKRIRNHETFHPRG